MFLFLIILSGFYSDGQGRPIFGPHGELISGMLVQNSVIQSFFYSDTVPRFRPSVQIDDSTLFFCRGPFMHVLEDNTIYALLQSGPASGYPRHIRFTKSLDTGRIWLKPNKIIRYDPDTIIMYPSMAIDNRSIINVIWAEPYVGGIQFSRSTDGGVTWTNRVRVDDGLPNGYIRLNPDITTGINNLYASWMESPSSPQNWSPWVKRSTDGGITWVSECQITGLPPSNTTLGRPYTRYDPLIGRWYVMWVGTDGEVYVARSSNGINWQNSVATIDNTVDARYASMALAQNGTLYVVWTEARYGQYDTDIFLSRSVDGGVTWSNSILVNDRAGIGANQYEPHIAVDKKGNLHVSWIECVPFGPMTHAYYTISTDNGNSWLMPNLQVTDILSNITPSVPYSISIAPDTSSYAYIGWVYIFGAPTFNFFSTNCPGNVKVEAPPVDELRPVRLEIFPNPLRYCTTIKYQIPESRYRVSMKILNISGRVIKQFNNITNRPLKPIIWDGRDDHGQKVAEGVYLLWFKAGDYTTSKKLVLLR